MRSLTDPIHPRKRGALTMMCALFSITAVVLGFSSASGAQELPGTFEDQKISVSDGEDDQDGFGYAVAVDGDTMVLGAPSDDDTGAVYVFELTEAGWQQQARLAGPQLPDFFNIQIVQALGGPTLPEPNSGFGQAVAIDGDTIVVGAPFEPSLAGPSPVGILQIASFGSGAAYVFERNGNTWEQTERLENGVLLEEENFRVREEDLTRLGLGPSELSSGQFGFSVAIDGDVLAVGAPAPEYSPFGSVHVFERDGNWTQQDVLSSFDYLDLFGHSVDIDGNTIIAGAPLAHDFSADPFVEENQELEANGAAYIFDYDGDSWELAQRLTNDGLSVIFRDISSLGVVRDPFVEDEGDQFGYSVAIDGTTAVVGALLEDGDTGDEGAAYVFEREEFFWVEQDRFTPANSEPGARFGRSVAIEGDTIVAGAPLSSTGSAYTFERQEDHQWQEIDELVGSNVAQGEGFGFSVALSNETAVVGAPLDFTAEPVVIINERLTVTSASPLGIHGEVPFELVNGAGDAYVFDLSEDEVIEKPIEPLEPSPLFCNGEVVTVNLAHGDKPTDGDDVILGTDGPDTINAGDGNDIICGEGGDDIINGDDGPDMILGGSGDDIINGGQGPDTIFGNAGDDFVSGGKGKDTIYGGSGDDSLRGNDGTDTINGGSGNDELRGGQKADTLNGDNGNDDLVGGGHPDSLNGGNGVDTHNGGAGTDSCVADPIGRTETVTSCEE